ncbi:MAG: methionine synthase [Halieaceae bacterium]
MSEHTQADKDSGDGMADAVAATAVIAVVIAAVVYWLAGMPA